MRIGTRGSRLALAQARWVAERIPAAELITLTTAGDRGADVGDKSRWTGELERALLEERIDLAVHSAKDVPVALAEGTAIVAVPPREDPLDVLIGAPSLDALAPGARVGTVSLRRAAQLRARAPGLEIVPLRGNVDTRLRRLREGACEAVVLARAGLARLGRLEEVDCVLEEMVPAAGQGTLALQGRSDLAGDERLRAVDEPRARTVLAVERELVAALGATCNTPIGILARPVAAGMEMRSWVGLPDGSAWVEDRHVAPAERVAAEVSARLTAAGARDLLRRAELVA